MSTLLNALWFSAQKHAEQRRKSPPFHPYINHPILVANILEMAGEKDIHLLQGAILHDILEDTSTDKQEILDLFGDAVLTLVLEVTEDKNLPKQERKLVTLHKLKSISHQAKLIKLADLQANVKGLSQNPPKDWSPQRCFDFLSRAIQYRLQLKGTHPLLEKQLDQVFSTELTMMKSFLARASNG